MRLNQRIPQEIELQGSVLADFVDTAKRADRPAGVAAENAVSGNAEHLGRRTDEKLRDAGIFSGRSPQKQSYFIR